MFDFANKARRFRTLKTALPKAVAREAKFFFLNNWSRQGFYDTSLTPWARRRGNREPKRPILFLTGRLKRGTKIVDQMFGKITIANDVPYAYEHNEGVNQTKRQFMGNSAKLEGQIEKMIEKSVSKILF
jgi:hypothetical protein